MNIEKDDLVIVEGDKRQLLQVLSRKGLVYTGVVDNSFKYTDNKQIMSFSLEDVICVLPSIAPPGKVFGVKVEPVNSVALIKPWGEVVYRRYLADSEVALINKVLNHVGKIVHQSRLSSYLPIEVEIRPHTTKAAGWYITTKKTGKLDTLVLCPSEFCLNTDDESAKPSLFRLLLHEFGHHVWAHYLTNELRAKWIKLYHHTVSVEEAGKEKLTQLHTEFANSNMMVSQFKKYLKDNGDTEDLELFDSIIKYIIKIQHITVRNMNMLMTEGSKLSEYWPKSTLQLSKVTPVISEYGKKSADEFFCEALSFLCVGNTIQPTIANAINITMKMLGAVLPIVKSTPQVKAA